MNKHLDQHLNKQKIAKVISVSALIFVLSSCSQDSKQEEANRPKDNPSAKSSAPALSSAAGSKETIEHPLVKNGVSLGGGKKLPEIPPNAHMEKLPNNLTICSVNNIPLTMDEYRRQFKAQQQQIQAGLSVDQNAVVYLLDVAKKRGIVLDQSETARLLKTAHLTETIDKKKFDRFLADNKMTVKQFDQQVLDVGLAAKAGNRMIEEGLLPALVNRQLLAEAAKESGFTKQAMNKFSDIKASKDFKKMQKATGFSDQELEDEVIKNQLSQIMIDKLQKDNPVSEADIRKVYDQHKDSLKHGARIKIMQIVLAAPKENVPNVESLKSTIKKGDPKLTGAALDQKVEEARTKQKAKANAILEQIKKGADFTKLANENTEDPAVKDLHNGGDTGWQEKTQVEPELVTACNQLAVNEVCGHIVESPYGYHIIKLTGKDEPGVIPFDEVKEQLRTMVKQKHDEEVVNKWLAEHLNKATVVFSPEFEAALSNAHPHKQPDKTTALKPAT